MHFQNAIFVSQKKHITDLLKKSKYACIAWRYYRRYNNRKKNRLSHIAPDNIYAIGVVSKLVHNPKQYILRWVINQKEVNFKILHTFIKVSLIIWSNARSNTEVKFRCMIEIYKLSWIKIILKH